MPNKKKIPFRQVLTDLENTSQPFPPVHLHRFSDLDGQELQDFVRSWGKISLERKINLLESLEDLAESDDLLSFENVGRSALEDANPAIKELAIRLLWENPSFDLMQKFLNLVNAKEETLAATAASALGNYVYLGEVEELPQSKYEMVIEGLFDIYNSTAPKLVRRRALESLGFANLEEVKEAIQGAYESGDKEWVISALYAMGRSLDDIWNPAILLNLKNKDPEIRFEAIRAAGEMELNAARPDLMMLLKDRDLDKEIRFITIWALSRIGGEGVRELLELLSRQVEDDEEAEILDDALEYMDFCEGVSLGELFSIDQEDLSEFAGDQVVEDLLDNLDQDSINKSSEDNSEEEPRNQRKRHKKHGE